MQRHAQEIAPSLPLASFPCLDLAGSHGVAPAGRTRPEHPTVRGPSSCPWEPGPRPKTVPTADSSGSLHGNHQEARKLPGGISCTASWFFEVTSLA